MGDRGSGGSSGLERGGQADDCVHCAGGRHAVTARPQPQSVVVIGQKYNQVFIYIYIICYPKLNKYSRTLQGRFTWVQTRA